MYLTTKGTLFYLVFGENERDKIDGVYDLLVAGGHATARIACFGGYENAIEFAGPVPTETTANA